MILMFFTSLNDPMMQVKNLAIKYPLLNNRHFSEALS